MNRGFAFYENYYATMQFLPQEQKEKFALAIIEYGMEGKVPEDGTIAALLQAIMPSIDNSVERFNTGNDCGPRGGRPNKVADEALRDFLIANPKATAKQVAENFGLSESAVQKREIWKNRKNLVGAFPAEWRF